MGLVEQYVGYTEEGQERVSGGVIDDLILLRVAWTALETLKDEKGLIKFLGNANKDNVRKLRMAATSLGNVVNSAQHHLIINQQQTIYSNTHRASITVSAGNLGSAQQYTNIRHDLLKQIVIAATGSDNCEHCIRTGKEVKDCKLKQALDTVPGLADRQTMIIKDMCPYGCMEVVTDNENL